MKLGRWLFRLVLAGALAVCLGYLPYQAYGPDGVARALRLEFEMKRLVDGNRHLKIENAKLQRMIKGLRNDRWMIEQVARDELGMVKADDIIFQL